MRKVASKLILMNTEPNFSFFSSDRNIFETGLDMQITYEESENLKTKSEEP